MELLKAINPDFFGNSEALFHLFKYMSMSVTCFFVVFYAGDIVLGEILEVKFYKAMKWKDKADFLSRITA